MFVALGHHCPEESGYVLKDDDQKPHETVVTVIRVYKQCGNIGHACCSSSNFQTLSDTFLSVFSMSVIVP